MTMRDVFFVAVGVALLFGLHFFWKRHNGSAMILLKSVRGGTKGGVCGDCGEPV
jgi:hypothetical protein